MDRSWEFPLTPGELWEVLSRTEDYRSWWSWLRSLDTAGGLAEGGSARCEIGPPLPHVLRLTVDIVRLVPPRSIEARVTGDLQGPAKLDIEPGENGSRARLRWELTMGPLVLQLAARVARPLFQWGHDWCVDTGVAQFRRRAISRRAPGPAGGAPD